MGYNLSHDKNGLRTDATINQTIEQISQNLLVIIIANHYSLHFMTFYARRLRYREDRGHSQTMNIFPLFILITLYSLYQLTLKLSEYRKVLRPYIIIIRHASQFW